MTRAFGTTVAAIERLLTAQGLMTVHELSVELRLPRNNVQPVVRRMLRPGRHIPKRVYIASWTDEVEGTRRYLRPQYAVGALPDKKKPATKQRAQVQRDYRARLKGRAMNFVFNLGNVKL